MRKEFSICALALSSFALAGPTGLGMMPIADILKHMENQTTSGATGFDRRISKGFAYQNGFLLGVRNRAEIGYDNDFLGNTVYNAKLQLFDESVVHDTALSVGTQNFANGNGDFYVVGRRDTKACRFHAGLLHSDEYHPMIGADTPWGQSTLQLEFMAGRNARATASVVTAIQQVKGLQVMLGISAPTDQRNGVQYFGQFIYNGRL